MARIGVAVVGAGFMGPVHAEALRRAGCEVVGVLGVSDAETTRFAANVGARGYRSLVELL
ncbi:MAG TPA: Gfo/Idh/MocA family oxidoreductase, partial [Vicinamibacteria bacterium]|nr:Gfo/Idh/MocA family oxidoreductase [Vicinamibacteria bacterium]